MRLLLSSVLSVALLVAPCAPAPVLAQSGGLMVEEARVSVQVDSEARAILGKVLLTLRNRTGQDLAAVDLKIPDPYGAAAKVGVVWDRNEELPWRRLVTAETLGEFHLQVPLTRTLGKGKKVIVGVSFEVHLTGEEQDGTRVAPDSFALTGSGWYPMPAVGEAAPERIRLAVRLPNDWELTGPRKAGRKHKGYALSEYEVKYDGKDAGRVVFAARAPASE